MLIGKRLILNRATIGLEEIDGRPRAISIPAGVEIKVVSDLRAGKMVDVLWAGRTIEMFEVDLQNRGRELMERHESARGARRER